MIINFAYVDKPIDPRNLVRAWEKLSTKYEPLNNGGVGATRRTMLNVLDFDTQLDPGNIQILKKDKLLPNGRTDKVVTGVAHIGQGTGVNPTVYTLAGNPLTTRPSKFKDLHTGAIDALGDHLSTNYPPTAQLDIHTTKATEPLYARKLGYMGQPMSVQSMNDWRKRFRR